MRSFVALVLTLAVVVVWFAISGPARADTPVGCSDLDLESAVNGASGTTTTLTLAYPCTYNLSGMTSPGPLNVSSDTNLTIDGNGATITGGTQGAFEVWGTLNVSDAVFTGNAASGDGGVFHVESGATLDLNGLTLTNNTGYQGGVVFSRGTVHVADSTISSNSAGWSGGALFSYGPMSVSGTTIDHNTAVQAGGGIYSSGSSAGLTVTNTTFDSNSSGTGGGGAMNICESGTVTISGSSFLNNTDTHGGAIYICDYMVVNISGSEFLNNVAVNGGAILNIASTVSIDDSTIGGNSATNSGGAILNEYDFANLTVTGSTFTGNVDGGGTIYNKLGATATLHRNAITGTLNTVFGVYNDSGPVDAQCNWWGAADGPGGVEPGLGDGVSANVAFAPWLLTPDLSGPCVLVIPVPAGTSVTPPTQWFGQPILLQSSGLTGTTEVLMNGVPAMFTVVSDSELRAIVTPGAGAGPVDLEVATPAGTFTLPHAFRAAAPPPPDIVIPPPTPACQVQVLTLSGQWTLIAWPGATMPVTQAVAASSNGCTATVATKIAVIWSYDASSKMWRAYFESGAGVPGANDLATIQHGMGYFVGLANPASSVQWKVEVS